MLWDKQIKNQLMQNLPCIVCKGGSYKNGFDRNNEQRYKCAEKSCGKSFTKTTIKNLNDLDNKRVVLHLLLAGCKIPEIAEKLNIKKSIIKGWMNTYLKELSKIVPGESLLSLRDLITIYRGIEKGRISKLFFQNRHGHFDV